MRIKLLPHTLELTIPQPKWPYDDEVWTLGDEANRAFRVACNEAIKSKNHYLTSVHVLAGLLDVAAPMISSISMQNDWTTDNVWQIVKEEFRPQKEKIGSDNKVTLHNETLPVLSQAILEARNLSATYIEVEHLLLGLSKSDCAAQAWLIKNNLTSQSIYAFLRQKRTSELLEFTKKEREPPYDPYQLENRVVTGSKAKYRLIRYVSIGGMGAVYAALRFPKEIEKAPDKEDFTHYPLHFKPICVKFLKPDIIAQHTSYKQEFLNEIHIVEKLIHPNIIRIFDTGQTEGKLLFYVMEWLEGISLEDRINKSLITIDESIKILAQTCSALHTAHQGKVIHLDVKPGNIMLVNYENNSEHVKVIDFGLAKVASTVGMTTTLTKIGFTLQYCAPEVFEHKASPRSDVFSLGATLYVMLAGVMPFGTSYIFAKQRPEITLPPLASMTRLRQDIPPEVDKVIAKALERDPRLRQKTVLEFLAEYKHAVGR